MMFSLQRHFTSQITNRSLFESLQFEAVSGPSTQGVPPFSWRRSPFRELAAHYGQPDPWHFGFERHQWGHCWSLNDCYLRMPPSVFGTLISHVRALIERQLQLRELLSLNASFTNQWRPLSNHDAEFFQAVFGSARRVHGGQVLLQYETAIRERTVKDMRQELLFYDP
ncbi:hypothetical protein HPB52_010554 [Rhipicephalus sanguineus]|uniref:Phospholipase B-like n=1 Tax=Rhipicephalus sanguineus TaxID=34632 RepID=A0A9D4Q099_RHISA|nr:hypothetical protein HPB52_010554 [Rhipicephalus sanguineus]